MPGHAETAPEAGLADLASFLTDNPEGTEDESEETPADESTEESEEEAANAQSDESEEDDDPERESDDPEDKKDPPAPERKIAVTIKGDDGTETTEEVSEEELTKSYMRQADYTRKTQALADREAEATQLLKSKHDEVRQTYLQQAETLRAAVVQMAGLKTEAEMAQLAQADPAAWVAENQRRQSIIGFVNQIDQQTAQERARAAQQAEEAKQQAMQTMFAKAWSELAKDKIDKPALSKIYADVEKAYGFKQTELSEVYDPRLVRVLRDAAAYRDLQAKSKEVTKKADAAPRLPQKQSTPSKERQDKALNDRFKGGRGKLTDLARLLT